MEMAMMEPKQQVIELKHHPCIECGGIRYRLCEGLKHTYHCDSCNGYGVYHKLGGRPDNKEITEHEVPNGS